MIYQPHSYCCVCKLFFISPRQLDDNAAGFWLAIIGPRFHELAALIQCVTSAMCLFGLVADDMGQRIRCQVDPFPDPARSYFGVAGVVTDLAVLTTKGQILSRRLGRNFIERTSD